MNTAPTNSDMNHLKKRALNLVDDQLAQEKNFLETLEVIAYKSEILEPKPKCLVLTATLPFSVANELTNIFVQLCGGLLAVEDSEAKLSIEELLNLNIDQMILWKTGKSLGKQVTRVEELFDNDPILEQSFSKKLSIIDGELLTLSSQVKTSLEVLSEIIHPNEYDYGHKSVYWDVFEALDLRI